MIRPLFLSVVALVLLTACAPRADEPRKPALKDTVADLEKRAAAEYASLEALYKHLHANPELSLQEEQTAARLARELKDAGFEVTTRVGGHGVVAVLKNGKGPVVMVRADMDGLPLEEKTGLPYASKVKVRDTDGKPVGVMHACGHDVNMTCLIGVARVLAQTKDRWKGTLVFVGQPAEEIGAGARAMLADGLFTKFPKPDYALALHCDSRYAHGQVNYRAGPMQANVDSVDIRVLGKGAHGAAPHTSIDPVVLAARIVLDLQTISSRERDPFDPVVVTVGSIHGGTKHNIIPSEVKLQLTVRTVKDTTRKETLEAIERIARAAAKSANAPEPEVKVDPGQFTPALVNDEALTKKMVAHFREALGEARVQERGPSMGGEDFSQFVRAGVPGFYFFLGTAPPEKVAEAAREGGRPLALTHTDAYAPVPEPTIKTGVVAMSLAVLHLLETK